MSAWNKGRLVGPKSHFTQAQIFRLIAELELNERWHDLCLLQVAIDSMLRCSDLLALKVSDLTSVEPRVRQRKTGNVVSLELTPRTRHAVSRWVEQSCKQPDDFLFTRTKAIHGPAIEATTYRDVIKSWAAFLGLEIERYSTHSLRRTKPYFLYQCGVDIARISELLGHRDIRSTYRYLGISNREARAEASRFDIFDPACKPEDRVTLATLFREQVQQRKLLQSIVHRLETEDSK